MGFSNHEVLDVALSFYFLFNGYIFWLAISFLLLGGLGLVYTLYRNRKWKISGATFLLTAVLGALWLNYPSFTSPPVFYLELALLNIFIVSALWKYRNMLGAFSASIFYIMVFASIIIFTFLTLTLYA